MLVKMLLITNITMLENVWVPQGSKAKRKKITAQLFCFDAFTKKNNSSTWQRRVRHIACTFLSFPIVY